MHKLSIYLTPSHTSITVANGVSREASGSNPADVVRAMVPADKETLYAFCRAVLALAETGHEYARPFPLVTSTIETGR